MSVTPIAQVPVTEKLTAPAAAKKALTSPWASLAAFVIAVFWTVPTAGLLISSFRPEHEVKTTGWWHIFAHPSFTFENYRTVFSGTGETGLFPFIINSIAITVPSIRPTLIVVLTTITITTLKAFDIVRQTTGGNYKTSVLSYEYYRQSFQSANWGLGSALAVLIFVLVLPVVIYNVRQMRKLEAR